MARQTKGKWSRRSADEWRALMARFDGSSLGIEAFCRREAISAASFYRWRGLLDNGGDGREAVSGEVAPAFVDLGTLDPAPSSKRKPRIELKLELGDGLVLHLVRH